MKKTLLAAALAVGAIIAVPIAADFAQSADPQAPPAASPPGDGQAMPPMGGGPMMRHMMMHRAMGGGDPHAWCIDRLAWRAARLAYVETKLDLTAAQRPLWEKVADAAHAEQQKERQLCTSLPTSAAPATVLERMDRMQQFLSARLDGLREAQPAVAALYQALTPAQRAILDHPFHRS
jgi:LTXXQ motif family protein